MPLSVIRSIATRKYTSYRGIDLLNNETEVDARRSPDCLNVWKSYQTEQSNIIQTRPGIKVSYDYSDENADNNTVYQMYSWDTNKLVHVGKRLMKPGALTPTTLYSSMSENESCMASFGDYIFILDGTQYLRTDMTNVTDMTSVGTTPITTIGRSPSGRRRAISRYKLVIS